MVQDVSRTRFLAVLPALALGTQAANAQQVPLRVGAAANESFAEAYYAQELGLFTRAGLSVEITTLNNGPVLSAAVAGGALDIGISSVISLANATIRGLPFVYIASGGLYLSSHPTIVLCVARNSDIRTPKDFEGSTLSVVTLKDITHLASVAYLAQNRVDLSKVKFIEVPFSEVGAALQRGTIAAGIISEPSLTAAANDVRVFAKAFDAIGSHFMIGGWFVRTDWFGKNVALALRFASVIYEAAKWANSNPTLSAAILQKYTHIDSATVQKMVRVAYGDSLTPDLLTSTLDLSYRFNFTTRRITAAEMIARS
jgi:NitT/TauT family transport system substrate-binding protein